MRWPWAAVRPIRAAVVGAARASENSQGRCDSSLGVDLGALLGKALAWALRPVGSEHVGVVLGSRHAVDFDPFLYPASPY